MKRKNLETISKLKRQSLKTQAQQAQDANVHMKKAHGLFQQVIDAPAKNPFSKERGR